MSTKIPTPVLPFDIKDDFTDTNTANYDVSTQGDPSIRHYIVGNDLDNTLTGGDKDDTLYGGLGTNHLNGGKGNDWFITGDPGSGVQNVIDGGDGKHDTVDYSGATGAVTVDLGNHFGFTSGHLDNITGVEDVVGSNFNDIITGDGGNDTLNGGFGADILEGGAGADVLRGLGSAGAFGSSIGLDGDNTASYAHSGEGVTVNLATGTGSGGDAQGDTLVDIQNLTGSTHDDTLIGDNGDNVLDGGDGKGNDVLEGGGGADTLKGGDGEDTASYQHATSGVALSLATGGTGGEAAGDTFDSIEDVVGSDHKDTITGNGKDNVIDGGKSNDVLDGAGGADTLIGGLGVDTLTGGAGNDVFKFNSMGESLNAPGAFDTITDFQSFKDGDKFNDKIDLHKIDANTGVAGNQDFTLVANFTGNAGEVRSFVDQSTGNTIVQAYDGTDTFQVELTGAHDLTASNFVF